MIKRKLLKTVALGLCMSALIAGNINMKTAYAQSGGGTSPAFGGTISPEDSKLLEKQREMDQYLFVDHAEEIEEMSFKVIYTGVADNYVEVGIAPYSEENAQYLLGVFGYEMVKVVDTEEAVLFTTPEERQNTVDPVAPDNSASPIMDMGDTPVSDNGSDDETLIKEREQLMTDEEEELSIQIESIGGSDELSEAMDSELIRQTGSVEDLSDADYAERTSDDGRDIRLVSAEDDIATTSSVGDVENEDKGLPTASIIAIVATGIIIIGGTAYTSAKKRAVKKD